MSDAGICQFCSGYGEAFAQVEDRRAELRSCRACRGRGFVCPLPSAEPGSSGAQGALEKAIRWVEGQLGGSAQTEGGIEMNQNQPQQQNQRLTGSPNAVATQRRAVAQELLAAHPQFTPEQMQLIVDTIAKGATPDELKLFLYRAKELGLDPLKPGQIYFVKYGSNPGSVLIGLDGLRLRAQRTGKLAGIARGVLRNDKGELIGAWAEVHRADWPRPVREESSLAEYAKPTGTWKEKPETMIKKVAEMAALRMAFPDACSDDSDSEFHGGIDSDDERFQPPAIEGDVP